MARPLRIQYPDAYYHVTSRGNERKQIFSDEKDHKAFLERLSLSLDIYHVSLLAYVCMPNHFHLLVTTPEGNLSEFMRHFNISYTSAFNRRHGRVGHLYQGRYKAFLIDADHYLLEVSRYIHLNPIRIKKDFSAISPNETWDELLKKSTSSLRGYLSGNRREDFVNYRVVLGYMGGDTRKGRKGYRQFIQWGIEQEIENPLALGKEHSVVGEDDFIQWIKERYVSKNASRREQPALRKLGKGYRPEELIECFSNLMGKSKEGICQRGSHSLERSMLLEMLYRFCEVTQPEIGKLVGGIDYSAVSQARRRLQIRLEREPKLKKRFDSISDQLMKLSRKRFDPYLQTVDLFLPSFLLLYRALSALFIISLSSDPCSG